MRVVKSERLKKMEGELRDLEEWLKLGLVPKKDVNNHKQEIKAVKQKIEDEKDRLQFLKESGESEEYIAPKRTPSRTGHTEMPTIPDIDVPETAPGFTTEAGFEAEQETTLSGASRDTQADEDETQEETREPDDWEEEKDEESYFSDRNRWRRGGIVDPDADEW